MHNVMVKTRAANYPVRIGYQILSCLPELLEAERAAQVFVVYDRTVESLHGDAVRRFVGQSAATLREIGIAPGERSKSTGTLSRLYDFMLGHRIARDDLVLAVGGGVVSDLAGYAAATVLRGVRWGVISTTLLGMVDAAIGGKTGINHGSGKNLIGAFWQPRFVLCDTCFLKTLAPRHRLAGWGEVAKYAGLVGGKLLTRIVGREPETLDAENPELLGIIRDCAAYKAHVVAADEREAGRRMLLNFGHTLGHGIETAAGHARVLHGEAVILGLWAATELSILSDHADESDLADYRDLLRPLLAELPRVKVDPRAVMKATGLDKKRSGQSLRFVLLAAPGSPLIADNISEAHAKKALQSALGHLMQAEG